MYDGRAALIGDAAFIPRPYTAASTSKAASNAIALGEALQHNSDDVEAALAAWEPSQLYLGQADIGRHDVLAKVASRSWTSRG
jgi:2-polyprenyl-6-methoxyphenol hydroxylase-like FAD-dependent oxidoreductase